MNAKADLIALTIGDPNGIGPEIAVKAAAAFADEGPRVVLVGDAFVVRHYAERFAPALPISEDLKGQAGRRPGLTLLGVESLSTRDFTPGVLNPAAGRALVDYLAAAIRLCQEERARGIVACPHTETAIHAAGIPFSGYPSLLARLMDVSSDRVFLMLVGGGLRIVHCTLHERLASALARLTPELVEAAALAAIAALREMKITGPKLGLFGINPHAGEGGLFGDDDERITLPAAQRLRFAGVDIEGPLGADLLLGRRDCDAFVAMYHDQGHIPVKLLAGRTASALSIGAGLLFSSVGHGSAYDIAGRGCADPEAVTRAIRLVAGQLAASTSAARSP